MCWYSEAVGCCSQFLLKRHSPGLPDDCRTSCTRIDLKGNYAFHGVQEDGPLDEPDDDTLNGDAVKGGRGPMQ